MQIHDLDNWHVFSLRNSNICKILLSFNIITTNNCEFLSQTLWFSFLQNEKDIFESSFKIHSHSTHSMLQYHRDCVNVHSILLINSCKKWAVNYYLILSLILICFVHNNGELLAFFATLYDTPYNKRQIAFLYHKGWAMNAP